MNDIVSNLNSPVDTRVRFVRIMFDNVLVVNSWDTLELDMVEHKAYVKSQGVNTQEIVRFRVIDDERSSKNN